MIYLDANATTPLDPRVLNTIVDELQQLGNASSAHAAGQRARTAVHGARVEVADLLGADPREIVFTAGATEADNLAVLGATPDQRRTTVVCPTTEHPAVLEPVRWLHANHRRGLLVPVSRDGVVDLDALAAVVDSQTLLVSVMAVNNETGVMAPLPEVAEIAHRAGALFHTDATQLMAWGPVDVDELGVDLLSLSAHKMHGPAGVGALYVREEVQHRLIPRLLGGAHENGLRSGTLNTPGIAGFGHAARIVAQEGAAAAIRVGQLRDELRSRLAATVPVHVHGDRARRAPGTLNVAMAGAAADRVLAGAPEVAASRGSACAGAGDKPSPVLVAMGVPLEQIECSMRLSLHRNTTEADVARAAELLGASAAKVRHRTVEDRGAPELQDVGGQR